MATTDNVLSDLIINDLTQEQYDALVASGEVQEGQIYATDGAGSGGGSTTGGLESVAHDSTLDGAGTTANPLKVASTVIAQINDKADGTVVETLSSVVSENTTKLNTLRNDTDSLGDQVSGIEEKIPSSASATNQLATKADLPIGFDATVVTELPAIGEKGIIYLVPKDGEAPDIHDEYIWIDSEQKFEFIGSTAVDLTDYVKKTDYATATVAGVVKAGGGNGVYVSSSTGDLVINRATNSEIAAKTSATKPIVPSNLDYAVKTSITTNTIELTDGEKTAAQDWLGIKQGASLPILMAMWSDHLLNDISWLRADTFSWHSGDVYKAVYEHLVGEFKTEQKKYYAWSGLELALIFYTEREMPLAGDIVYTTGASEDEWTEYGTLISDYDGGDFYISSGAYGAIEVVRSESKDIVRATGILSETIDGITISYYLAQDGHKICLPDQESNLVALYEKTGAADYYLLDTTNKQFKLPRKQKRTLIQAVKNDDGTWYNLYSDGWVEQGGQIIRGVITFAIPMADLNYTVSGAQIRSGSTNATYYNAYKFVNMRETGIDLDNGQSENPLIAWSVSGYAAESAYASAGMRLEYYYVGNFEQSATEQTAGLNAELFNGKADRNLLNTTDNVDIVIESQLPTASNGYTWYRKYKSGWVEQGGNVPYNSSSVTFPVEFADTAYYFNANLDNGGTGTTLHTISSSYTTVGCVLKEGQDGVAQRALTANAKWFACGMAA